MKNLTEINLEKSRSGVYQDTAENRRLHRVGQRYGEPKKEEISSESKKSGLEELKQDMLQAERELRAHNERKGFIISYTGGEKNWLKTKEKLEQKLDTLQQEYKRRFAEVNKKPEQKKPTFVRIKGKTFRVDGDGRILASAYDTQERISKLLKFAAENGYKVKWEESKTVQKPEQERRINEAQKQIAEIRAMSDEEFSERFYRFTPKNYRKATNAYESAKKDFISKWGSEPNSVIGKISSMKDANELVEDGKNLMKLKQEAILSHPLNSDTVEEQKRKFINALSRGRTIQSVIDKGWALGRTDNYNAPEDKLTAFAFFKQNGIDEDKKVVTPYTPQINL